MTATQITVVFDRDSSLTPKLRTWNNPRRGVIVAMVRSSHRTTGWLATDLLTALGKTSGRNYSADGWAVAASHLVPWLVVEDVKHIVIGYAESLPIHQLVAVAHVAQLAEVAVWFVSDAGTSDNLAAFADDFGATTVDGAEFDSHMVTARTASSPTDTPTAPVAFPREVPDDSFLTFLATARQTMSDESFAQVLDLFVTAFDDTRAWLPTVSHRPTELEVARHVSTVVGGHTTLACVTTAMRGVQAEAFRDGLLIRLDARRFLNRMSDTQTALDLNDVDWQLLSDNGNTRQCAIAVLAALGIPVADIHTMAADNVASDASSVRAAGQTHQVPRAARPLLLAQLLYRACAAHPDDPLLLAGSRKDATYTVRGISLAIDELARATGIAFRAAHDRWDSDSMHWRQRSGIHITELAA